MLEKIKNLRQRTGVSIGDCKKALEEAGGDIEKACLILKKFGLETADKKSGRALGAGIIESYIHGNGKVGVLIDLRSETDFVAKNPVFKELAHELAMQIAALNARFVSKEDVPETINEELKEVFKKEVEGLNKPPEIIQKIVAGKIDAILKEQILLEQPFIKNQDQTVADFLREAIQKFGENIKINRFARFEI